MVTVTITSTARTPHHTSQWTCYDERQRCFASLGEAKAFLKDEYFHCKTTKPMYVDTAQGTIRCGTIYCYREKDYNASGRFGTVYHQDWAAFMETTDGYSGYSAV